MTKLVNLTPHAISVQLPDGKELILPSTGAPARLQMEFRDMPSINGIPCRVQAPTVEVIGLPEPVEGTIFIVASMMLEACKNLGRMDVASPDTNPDFVIRDDQGRIKAIRNFLRP